MLTVAILAGGLASRLAPVSIDTPKSMIKILDKPFIDYQLEMLASQNIKKVVICVGNLSSKIIDHVGDGSQFGLKIIYSNEGKKLKGTGGAIKQALQYLGENFFVLYGDSYLNINYKDFFKKFAKLKYPILMTIY